LPQKNFLNSAKLYRIKILLKRVQNVIVETGAKVLGNMHIGDRIRIGAGSIVLQNVPNDCTVVGIKNKG
jgi:serine acetyltransferase